MLVDVGAETTTVSIYKDGSLVYLTTLPLGGRNITRDITMGLNVLEDTAERVKKNISNPLDKNVDHISIEGVNSVDAANYIVARTGEIIANIKQQIQYAGVKTVDLHNIVLIGGGAQLQGIDKRIEDEIKLRVRKGSYPHDLNILDHNINRAEYIQVFSLLSNAARTMPFNQTCIRMNTYNGEEDGFTPSYRGTTENDDNQFGYGNFREEEPAPAKAAKSSGSAQRQNKRGKTPSWVSRYQEKFKKLMSEPEDEGQDI